MEWVEETIDGVNILEISDRLDASCVAQFKSAVLAMVDEKKLKILVDMTAADVVDSSGSGTLVTCLRTVSKAGGVFKISSLGENPKHLFQTTRLDRVFDLYDDRDAALRRF
jgi:anti-sigma B factor antagonist